MAKKFYDLKNANNIRFIEVTDDFNNTDITNRLVTLNDEAGRPDEEKLASLRNSRSPLNLDEYNSNLQDEIDELSELLDLFAHPTQTISFNEIIPMYITPEAVESFCAEDLGNEAILSIDGSNSTWWQDSTNHAHEIIYRIRGYPKKVIGFQIRRGGNVRSQLTNLEVRVARNINGLDKNTNIGVTGVTLPTTAAWNEVAFTKKQIGEYIKLTFDSDHASNEARIREIQVLVEPNENL